jgi:hypothetical protein
MRCTAPMFGMLALAATAGGASAASPASMTATPVAPGETLQGTAPPPAPAQPLPTDPQVRRVTTAAMADLAGRLSLPVERIDFVEFRPVLWPNRGLGCPRPGMIYPQVQEDGYLIRLRAGKHEFHYHGSGSRPPFLCEAGG